jgi:hypothetical protein
MDLAYASKMVSKVLVYRLNGDAHHDWGCDVIPLDQLDLG